MLLTLHFLNNNPHPYGVILGYFGEHFVKSPEDVDEGLPEVFSGPVGVREDFVHVPLEAPAPHGGGVVRRHLQEGVRHLCQSLEQDN